MGIHAALAVHPDSGHGRAGRIADVIARRLRDSVDSLRTVAPRTAEESRALLAEAREDGLDLLVVVGGDGSVHHAVQFCANHDVPLAVIPAGTGNDFARALGVPDDPLAAADALAAAIRAGRSGRVDLGKVAGGPWFATVLCAGFDSAVNERVNRMRWPHGRRRYDLAILAELAALKVKPLHLLADGAHTEQRAAMIAVGNTPYYGSGIPICPNADATDGVFDLTVVGDATRLDLLRILPSVRTGKHIGHPKASTLRAGTVRLGEANGWIAYADGDRIGPLPVEVSCVPGALTVFGPTP